MPRSGGWQAAGTNASPDGEVLDAARQALAEHGYGGTPVPELPNTRPPVCEG